MEYYINTEVITLDLSTNEGSAADPFESFYNIDFDILLRPFIQKYKYCNIELVQASQFNFGDAAPFNFVIYGLPWVNQTNINSLGTGRIIGGYDRQAIVQPSLVRNEGIIDIHSFSGQIETFSLYNIGKKEIRIRAELASYGLPVNRRSVGNIRLVFKFYPVYENYIDVIYNDDNERRKIAIR